MNTRKSNIKALRSKAARSSGQLAANGFSMVEMLIVVALIATLSALAVPQLIAERRLSRSIGVTREILSQLRYARQLAMSQRQAISFRYDNTTKQISIIDHNSNLGPLVLTAGGYPNTPGSVIVSTTPLATGGLEGSEIATGVPPGVPSGPLGDGISMTALTNNQLIVTFQPDGSVVDLNGNPVGTALFLYNNRAGRDTASAISVVGASGRIKIWRYDRNVNAYAE